MLPAGPLSSNRIHTSRTDRPFLESLPLNPSTDSSETPWHAYIEGIVEGRVRRLPGFRSFHRVPDIYNQATRAFVRKVGAERVEQTAERLYRELRLGFHYKRRDCHYTCEGGSALIRTPHFELEVDLDLDPAEPRNYRLRTWIPKLYVPAVTAEARFRSCFNAHCDRLVAEAPAPLDVAAAIDRIEAVDALDDALEYAPDAASAELQLDALDLHLRITPAALQFRLLGSPDLGKLLEHSRRAFQILASAGFGPGENLPGLQ